MQAIGGVLNIKWANDGIVTTGYYCTAQGVVAQIGELGVALIIFVCLLLMSLRARPRLNATHQLLAVHTFVSVVLQIGVKACGIAFTLVCLAFVFITLWVAIGAGVHKNYETPTPVRVLHSFIAILSSLLTLLGSVLVLDQPSVPARSPWWRNYLDVDRTICFGNIIRSTAFLGRGLLVVR